MLTLHDINMNPGRDEKRVKKEGKKSPSPQMGDLKENLPLSNKVMFKHLQKRWKVKSGNKQPLSNVISNNSWKNQAAYIIAGGPSVNQYDRKQFDSFLKDKNVIGINRAFQFFDNITINIAADIKFYNWIMVKKGAGLHLAFEKQRNKGMIFVWVDMINSAMDDVYYIRNIGREGLGNSLEEGIYAYSNTGYAALNLAYVLGANPIYMLGYDCCFEGEKHHYHNYPTGSNYDKTLLGFRKGLEQLAGVFKEKEIDLINLGKLADVDGCESKKIWECHEVDEYNFINKGEFLATEFQKDNPEYNRNMMCFINQKELEDLDFKTIDELREFNDKYIDKERLFFLREA